MNSSARRAKLAPKPRRRPTLSKRIEALEAVVADPSAKPHHVVMAQRLIDDLRHELERRRLAEGVTIAIMEHDRDDSGDYA